MRIIHGIHTLADDAKLITCRDLQSSAETQAQTVSGLRASYTRLYDRGNKQLRIQFAATRRHASDAEAEEYLLTHGQAVCGKATTTFTCGEPGDTQTLTLQNAMLSVARATRLGNSTSHTYTLTGGPIS